MFRRQPREARFARDAGRSASSFPTCVSFLALPLKPSAATTPVTLRAGVKVPTTSVQGELSTLMLRDASAAGCCPCVLTGRSDVRSLFAELSRSSAFGDEEELSGVSALAAERPRSVL